MHNDNCVCAHTHSYKYTETQDNNMFLPKDSVFLLKQVFKKYGKRLDNKKINNSKISHFA